MKIDMKKLRGLNYDDFWASTSLYNVLMGSKRSKKTLTTALKLVTLILQHPKNNCLVIRRIFADHKKSTFPSLVWAIKQLFTDPHTNIDYSRTYWDISSEKSKDLYIIYKPTKQQFLFNSLDGNQRINSLSAFSGSLNICWVEEAYEIESQESFETLTASVTQGDALYKRFFLTFNPFLETSWLKSYFFDKTPEQKKEQGIFTKVTTFRDNEFLGEDDLKTFENLRINNPKLFEIIGNSNWGAAEGTIFTNFEVQKFKSQDLDIIVRNSHKPTVFMLPHEKALLIYKRAPRFYNRYGMDYGYANDPAVLMKVTEDRLTKTLYVHPPIFYKTQMENSELASRIREAGLARATIFTDRSEPKTNAELYTLGIRDLRKQTYKSIEEGIRRMQNFKIIIQDNPLSAPTIKEFTNYRHFYDTKTDQLTSKIAPSSDHIIDAIRYSLCGMLWADLNGFLYT